MDLMRLRPKNLAKSIKNINKITNTKHIFTNNRLEIFILERIIRDRFKIKRKEHRMEDKIIIDK